MWVNYEALRVRLSGTKGLVCQHSGRTILMPATVGPWLSALIFLASRARGQFQYVLSEAPRTRRAVFARRL